MAAVDFFSNQVRTSFLFFIDIKSPMRRSFDIYGRRKILWDVESTSFVKLLWFPLFVNTRLKIFNYRISFFVVLLRIWKDPNRSSSSKHLLQQHQTHLTMKWWQAVRWYWRTVQGDNCSRLFLLEFLQNLCWASYDAMVDFFCKSTSFCEVVGVNVRVIPLPKMKLLR